MSKITTSKEAEPMIQDLFVWAEKNFGALLEIEQGIYEAMASKRPVIINPSEAEAVSAVMTIVLSMITARREAEHGR